MIEFTIALNLDEIAKLTLLFIIAYFLVKSIKKMLE